MSVARSLERRLERLLDAVAGRVFSGRLHPSELAGKLAREADFARFDHDTGPATANRYVVMINPRDLTIDPAELEANLTREIERYAVEEGLRLEGPVSVTIAGSEEVSPGQVVCHVEVDPGSPVLWARLISAGRSFEIRHNRTLIGRSPSADIVLSDDDISRSHALIWRDAGGSWIRDLGSANGTTVDGATLSAEPHPLGSGTMVSLSAHSYRFKEL